MSDALARANAALDGLAEAKRLRPCDPTAAATLHACAHAALKRAYDDADDTGKIEIDSWLARIEDRDQE